MINPDVLITFCTNRFVKRAPHSPRIHIPKTNDAADSSASDEPCITTERSTVHVRLKQQSPTCITGTTFMKRTCSPTRTVAQLHFISTASQTIPKTYSITGVMNGASTRHPNLTWALHDVDLLTSWHQKLTVSSPWPMDHTCKLAAKWAHSFSK